jgi:hypothetical protein
MSLKALAEMFNLFGKEDLLFGVFDKDLMIASSVCIKVSEEIFYCFYVGDHLRYRAHSPVTGLIAGIYMIIASNKTSLFLISVYRPITDL